MLIISFDYALLNHKRSHCFVKQISNLEISLLLLHNLLAACQLDHPSAHPLYMVGFFLLVMLIFDGLFLGQSVIVADLVYHSA